MVNKKTASIVNELMYCEPTIGIRRAAELLGIAPRSFKAYLENSTTLPSWAIEVTDSGERRTFRILTERFAAYISGEGA